MKHDVAKLEGVRLDVAVALATYPEDNFTLRPCRQKDPADGEGDGWVVSDSKYATMRYANAYGVGVDAYSEDWAHGGEIIECHLICLEGDPGRADLYRWHAEIIHDDRDGAFEAFGPTLLIAAMRVYVTSRLGTEIELP